jgi:glycosyltransferase involved in cell wall biosynthesis
MSGSRAHELDFAQIVTPILRIMREFSEVRLLIGGHAKLPTAFDPFQERIVTMPFMDYRGYLNFLANADINLVPLVQDEFNDCKSAIRFLEASLLGKPTIASSIGDFKNIVFNGDNGYLAENETEWYETTMKLVQSKALRDKMGSVARDHVLSTQTNNDIIKHMDLRLKNILNGDYGKATLNN